jgi:RHH-type proline utilization regulon transcriptional repressor/proline dehydrogenase/delta 1-pyrroline-5-carboxylate dehydrogenase
VIAAKDLQEAVNVLPAVSKDHLGTPIELPGPTGESNRLTLHPRGRILCLGPSAEAAAEQARLARSAGCPTLAVAPGIEVGLDGQIDPRDLAAIDGIGGVVLWGAPSFAREARKALAGRSGPIIPLITGLDVPARCVVERHLCIDTTAAGGNASLLSKVVD